MSSLNPPLPSVSEGSRGLQERKAPLVHGVSAEIAVSRARRGHGGLVGCQGDRESLAHLALEALQGTKVRLDHLGLEDALGYRQSTAYRVPQALQEPPESCQ